MHSRIRMYGAALLACLALAFAIPTGLAARPKPGVTPRAGFRLFARSLGASTVNRVFCGLGSAGRVCADSTGSSTIGGGFWPKGSPNEYIFNSGMQFAGIVDDPGGPWDGDTTGAFFFDANGNLSHGEEVQPIYNFQSSSDAASWPAAANVPKNDRGSSTFFPLLQGLKSASQGDIWFMTWDGNPAFSSGRSHPLGIMVETRMMGWNYPTGNQDILYLVYTFYNISSTCPASYTGIRPDMQAILLAAAARFQANNNAAGGITLPACGYNITNFYANMAADPDVSTNSANNYASVNLPFQLGFIYEQSFQASAGTYTLPPDLGPGTGEFMGGMGFFGIKYLASPDSAPGKPVGLTLFNSTQNGVDPNDVVQLYRFISGNLIPGKDPACNTGLPLVTHICNIFTAPHDDRMAQSSGPFSLPAGGSGSVVVAYIFASPVKAGPCQVPADPTVGPCGNLQPGDPRKLTSVAGLAAGNVNIVDSMTGFRGYHAGAETSPVPDSFVVAPGSLLAKAKVAQAVFDFKFLLPFAPAAPEFFLVPGDNQVSVFWKKSASEKGLGVGDLFYSVANAPTAIDPISHLPAPNPLYDPNYRQFDVEGYRVYRGRSESQLSVVAQFDYSGTTFSDYDGVVNPQIGCAPDVGVTATCAGVYDPIVPGVARTKHVDYPINGDLIQVVLNTRLHLANGNAFVPTADTAVTGAADGAFPKLADGGVPFVFVDTKALNNLRYFYAVTAFDVNSLQSGPSSLESAPNVKSVIPVHPATNASSTFTVGTPTLLGRGVDLGAHVAAAPTIDPVNGTFTGPMKATSNWTLGLAGAVIPQVLQGSIALSAQFDSLTLGASNSGIPAVYWFSAGGTPFSFTLVQGFTDINDPGGVVSGAASFLGPSVNGHQASIYGGNAQFQLAGQASTGLIGLYQTLAFGRGCINGGTGFSGSGGCDFNGARWFDGPSPANNETAANPTKGNGPNGSAAVAANFSNAGSLTGVVHAYEPRSYQTMENVYRNVEGVLGGAAHAADYNLYWGAAGKIDSVVDYTYNSPVPFKVKAGATWGVLNASAVVGGVLATTKFACVEPLRSISDASVELGGCATAVPLAQTVVPGPVIFNTGTSAGWGAQPQQANNGFGLYLEGHIFQFELTGGAVPASGTVWSLRTYTGAIAGGTDGLARNFGPYVYTPQPSPLNAPGAAMSIAITANNSLRTSTSADLTNVHTVPDPYYVTNAYEVSPSSKVIKFVNLPQKCIIRIYSTSGILVRILEHSSGIMSGEEDWDVRNRNNQVVASGVYFYSIEASNGTAPRVVKRLTIVNFAQ